MSKQKVANFAKGLNYWDRTPATVEGVLGGYGEATPVPRLDAAATRLLLLSLLPLSTVTPSTPLPLVTPKRPLRALDCGAGIGRITANVLIPLFDHVDMVDPVQKFVDQALRDARARRGPWRLLKPTNVVRVYKQGLQYFDPGSPATADLVGTVDGGEIPPEGVTRDGRGSAASAPESAEKKLSNTYNTILIQWVSGHLEDDDYVAFLRRCKAALAPENSLILVKENNCLDSDNGGRLFDDDDSSWTRSDSEYQRLFKLAGLELVRVELQQGFPIGAYECEIERSDDKENRSNYGSRSMLEFYGSYFLFKCEKVRTSVIFHIGV